MPYIVTTRRYGRMAGKEHDAAWSRRAVATLEEARDAVHAVCHPRRAKYRRGFDGASRLPESGGTVGPLPDGTVIEVERVGLNDLRTGTGTLGMTRDELIADFNAREANRR